MDFPTEEEAFDIWTQVQPDGMRGYLVDTYDAVQGVKNVIASFKKYGVKPDLVRNDSRDQVAFTGKARALLDEAGFHDCIVINTNDMNAAIIHGLESKGIENNGYGIGTWQAAQPSPGAVYKQAMTVYADGTVLESMKMSDEFKSTFPGAQRIARILNDDGSFAADVLVPYRMDIGQGVLACDLEIVRLSDKETILYPAGTPFYNPHVTLCTDGKINYDAWPTVMEVAAFARENLKRLPDKHRDLENPEPYAVCVESGLYDRFHNALALNDARKSGEVPAPPNFSQPPMAPHP
jgi:nicotinate phosphoribosyltransferase